MSGAHFHLIVNHLPVVGALFALLALLWAAWRGERSSADFAMICMLLLGITAGLAYVSGEPAEEAVEHIATVSHDYLEKHEDAAWFSLIAACACGAIGVFGLARRTERSRKASVFVGLAAVAITYGLMAWTANLGGMVRHTEIRPDKAAAAQPRELHEDDD